MNPALGGHPAARLPQLRPPRPDRPALPPALRSCKPLPGANVKVRIGMWRQDDDPSSYIVRGIAVWYNHPGFLYFTDFSDDTVRNDAALVLLDAPVRGVPFMGLPRYTRAWAAPGGAHARAAQQRQPLQRGVMRELGLPCAAAHRLPAHSKIAPPLPVLPSPLKKCSQAGAALPRRHRPDRTRLGRPGGAG